MSVTSQSNNHNSTYKTTPLIYNSGIGSSVYTSTFCKYSIVVNDALKKVTGHSSMVPMCLADVLVSDQFEHTYFDWIHSIVIIENKYESNDAVDYSHDVEVIHDEYYITKVTPSPSADNANANANANAEVVSYEFNTILINKKQLEQDLTIFTFSQNGLTHGAGWHANVYPQNNEAKAKRLLESLKINGDAVNLNEPTFVNIQDAEFNITGKEINEGPVEIKEFIRYQLESIDAFHSPDVDVVKSKDSKSNLQSSVGM